MKRLNEKVNIISSFKSSNRYANYYQCSFKNVISILTSYYFRLCVFNICISSNKKDFYFHINKEFRKKLDVSNYLRSLTMINKVSEVIFTQQQLDNIKFCLNQNKKS